MRVTARSSNVFPGGLRAGLVLVSLLLFLMLSSPRASLADVGVRGFPVATEQENETSAAVDGNTAVWIGGSDLRGKNLATDQALGLPAGRPGIQGSPSVDGRFVVWEETVSGDANIYGYDLVSRETFPVAVAAGSQTAPVVDGNLVVWEDRRDGSVDVYSYDLDAEKVEPVATGPGQQAAPAVGGNTVVWENRDASSSDIVAMDLDEEEQRTISGPGWQTSPAIEDGTVVWQEELVVGDYDVRGYDLAEDRGFGISGGPTDPGDQLSPTIGGRVVAWERGTGGNSDVLGKDLATGETFTVAGGSAGKKRPAASGEAVIWQVQRGGDDNFGSHDLLGARLDLAPLAPKGLTASGSADGVGLDWTRSPEDDLAGYNVYRAASENGDYTRLNARTLSGSSFDDSAAPKGARSFYKVTAVDAAGSESAASRANAVVPRVTGLSLSASPDQVGFSGGTVTLSGRLFSGAEGLPNKEIDVEQRPEGAAAWSPVAGGPAITAPDGGFTLAVPGVDRDTEYRAIFGGTEEALPSTSATAGASAGVDVKTTISVGTAKTVRLGRTMTISGIVLPNRTGEASLTIKRAGVEVDELTAQIKNNTFSTTYKPKARGSYQLVAAFGIGPDDAGTTATADFTVKRKPRR